MCECPLLLGMKEDQTGDIFVNVRWQVVEYVVRSRQLETNEVYAQVLVSRSSLS